MCVSASSNSVPPSRKSRIGGQRIASIELAGMFVDVVDVVVVAVDHKCGERKRDRDVWCWCELCVCV